MTNKQQAFPLALSLTVVRFSLDTAYLLHAVLLIIIMYIIFGVDNAVRAASWLLTAHVEIFFTYFLLHNIPLCRDLFVQRPLYHQFKIILFLLQRPRPQDLS